MKMAEKVARHDHGFPSRTSPLLLFYIASQHENGMDAFIRSALLLSLQTSPKPYLFNNDFRFFRSD
jgi:hypothetical protein